MTTEKEISEQIDRDYNKFWYSAYDAALPSDMMYKFRQAIMFQNVQQLQGNPQVLRDLLDTKEEDLKFVHVGIIINTLFSIPFNTIYDSPEQALEAVMELKQIEIEFNKLVQKRTQEIERKRAGLLELGGITGKTIPLNGLKTK